MAYQLADDGAVLLLDPGLIILAVVIADALTERKRESAKEGGDETEVNT